MFVTVTASHRNGASTNLHEKAKRIISDKCQYNIKKFKKKKIEMIFNINK